MARRIFFLSRPCGGNLSSSSRHQKTAAAAAAADAACLGVAGNVADCGALDRDNCNMKNVRAKMRCSTLFRFTIRYPITSSHERINSSTSYPFMTRRNRLTIFTNTKKDASVHSSDGRSGVFKNKLRTDL